MDFKKIHIEKLHVWLIGFQLVVAAIFYFIFIPFDGVLAQGAMMGVLAPTAVSATVIAVVLGGSMASMVSYTILSSIVIAVVAPIAFSLIGFSEGVTFWHSCLIILKKVAPVILFPMVLAFVFQKSLPKTTSFIVKRKMLPFYLWAITLTVAMGQTIDYILLQESSKIGIIIGLGGISIVQCLIQFGFGRWIGGKYGDKITGGQALGQKNTVLAIWMAQTYLNPLSSVVPATYVLWQNLFNSWQMIHQGRKK